jgi:hypothetical protein
MALAYVVGVLLYGDGYTSYSPGRSETHGRVEHHGTYSLALTAKSYRFVDFFNRKCSVVLGRASTKIIGPNLDGHFVSKYSSIDFLR